MHRINGGFNVYEKQVLFKAILFMMISSTMSLRPTLFSFFSKGQYYFSLLIYIRCVNTKSFMGLNWDVNL